jgi:hypothetical protein
MDKFDFTGLPYVHGEWRCYHNFSYISKFGVNYVFKLYHKKISFRGSEINSRSNELTVLYGRLPD